MCTCACVRASARVWVRALGYVDAGIDSDINSDIDSDNDSDNDSDMDSDMDSDIGSDITNLLIYESKRKFQNLF